MQAFMDEMRQMDPVRERDWHPSADTISLSFLTPTFTVPQVDPSLPVLVAGDKERANVRKVKEAGGIFYHQSIVKAMVGA